jgi:hypothetical protein
VAVHFKLKLQRVVAKEIKPEKLLERGLRLLPVPRNAAR